MMIRETQKTYLVLSLAVQNMYRYLLSAALAFTWWFNEVIVFDRKPGMTFRERQTQC